MSIEVMKMALEALEAVSKEMTVGERYTNAGQQVLDAIDHLRVAISQQPPAGAVKEPARASPLGAAWPLKLLGATRRRCKGLTIELRGRKRRHHVPRKAQNVTAVCGPFRAGG